MGIANSYKVDLKMLDENIERLNYELLKLKFDGRKRAGINARAILLNIKKLCHVMREKLNDDLKNRPIVKKNVSKETLEKAAEKRAKTIEEKKGKK